MKIIRFFLLIGMPLLAAGCVTVGGPPLKGMTYQAIYPNGMVHGGLDLDVPYGTPVRAIADGEVGIVLQNPNEIYLTLVHANGRSSMYYHLGKVLVKEREQVKRGQIIAQTGRTGYSSPARNQLITYPHLHLEVWKDGIRINPESLGMTCPNGQSEWWWPVGCDDFYKK